MLGLPLPCLGARSVPVLPCGQCPCWCSRSLACSDGSRDCMTSCHAATSRRSRTPRYRGDGCGRNSARRRRGVDDLPLTDTMSDRMARRSAPRTLRERVGRRPGEQIVVRSRRCRRRVSESSGDLRRRPARRTQWHCPKFGGSDSGASVRRRPCAWGGGGGQGWGVRWSHAVRTVWRASVALMVSRVWPASCVCHSLSLGGVVKT